MNSAKINVNTNYYSTNFKQYPPKAITNTIEQSAKAVQNHFKETAAVGAGLALTSLGVISAKPQTDEEAKKWLKICFYLIKKIYSIFDRMLDIITHIDNEAKQKVFNKGFIILDEKRNVVTVLRNEKDKFSIKDYIGLYTPGFTNKSLYADIDNVVMENKDLPAYNTLSELNSAINNIR